MNALMSNSIGKTQKLFQALNASSRGAEGSNFQKQLQSLMNQSNLSGNMTSLKEQEGDMLQDLKEMFKSIKQLLDVLPDDALKLDETMLNSLKEEGLWQGLSQSMKDDLMQLFDGEATISKLISGEDDLKNSQNMLALFAWSQTSSVQEVSNNKTDFRASELKQLLQSMNLGSTQEQKAVQNWNHSFIVTKEESQTSVNETKLTDQQQKQLQEIVNKLKSVFEKMGNFNNQLSSDTVKLEKQMFELAKNWLQFEKEYNVAAKDRSQLLQALKEQGISQKGAQIWDKVLNALQKRQSFTSMNQYSNDAKVTYKEFSKWMHNAWNNVNASSQTKREGLNTQQHPLPTASLDSMPMSKQEQFVIKVNSNQQDQTTQKQLIDQFQKIMNRSRFISNQQGQQLSIKLSPGNLGDMMVKMTQQNGEMMVKIMVTSQATKEMLEGNLQQLRHMFSPNQVSIEKQDLNVNTQQNMQFQKEHDEYSEEQPESQNTQQEEHDEHDEESESLDFHEMLLNEKV